MGYESIASFGPLLPILLPACMIWLCDRRPAFTHIFTFIMAAVCVLTTNFSEWKPIYANCRAELGATEGLWLHNGWFWTLKKPSLLIAYGIVVLMSAFPMSKTLGRILAFGVNVNVLEAVVMGAVNNDWACAIPMFMLVPLYPIQYVAAGGGAWTHDYAETRATFWPPLRQMISAQAYVRYYCVIFMAFHLFNYEQGGLVDPTGCGNRVYYFWTSAATIVSMEIYGQVQRSACRDMMIRLLGLVFGVIMDSTIDLKFNDRLDTLLLPDGYNRTIRSSPVLRNCLQVAFMALSLGGLTLLFGPVQPPPEESDRKK